MAAYVKVNDFVEDIAEGIHDLASDQLTVALSNTAPGAEGSDPLGDGNGVLANVTEISYVNCSSRNITTTSSTQTAGVYKLVLTDLVLTATGNVGPFRYVYIYNEDAVADELIAEFDYGSSISLANGETFTLDFSAANGLLQIT